MSAQGARPVVRDIIANGITLRVTEVGAGLPVLFLHGFPELAFSWRHQLPVVAGAGYRAIAYDQRGYGGSSRPAEVEAYDLDTLAADAIALMNSLNEPRMVVVGHDWGSPVAWHLALSYPERVQAVVSLSVPHGPRGARPPLELMREAAGPQYVHYIDYFQAPGVADAELAAEVRASILGFVWSISGDAPAAERFRPIRRGERFIDSITVPRRLPPWLTELDLQVYVQAFRATGFTGGLNWYRNVDRNWERSAHLAGAQVTQPALFITGGRDPARNPPAIERMRDSVPNLLGSHILAGCGHWTQQERPGEVNELLLAFLSRVAPVR
jgi:pimeloyl-ACP methyl ester carboxylesterase